MDGSRPDVPFRVELSSGRGLLDARALWAAMVGPHRLAMAKGVSIRLQSNNPIEVARNMGSSDAYMFVGVALPGVNPSPAPVQVLFSKQDLLGNNTSAPYNLIAHMGGGGFNAGGFMQLLLPGEQLFGIVAPGGPAVQQVVVSQVQF